MIFTSFLSSPKPKWQIEFATYVMANFRSARWARGNQGLVGLNPHWLRLHTLFAFILQWRAGELGFGLWISS